MSSYRRKPWNDAGFGHTSRHCGQQRRGYRVASSGVEMRHSRPAGIPAFPESRLTRDILQQKERHGLRVQNIIRIVVMLVFLPASALLAQSAFERTFTSIILAVSLAISVALLISTRAGRNLTAIGISGALLDVVILSSLPVIYYLTVGGAKVPASFLLKNQAILISILFIVANGQAMKPVYPAIVTAGAMLLNAALFAYALASPGIEFARDYLEAFTTTKLSVNDFVSKELILCGIGAGVALMNRGAQKTVVAAANVERASKQLGRFFSPNVAETIARGDDNFMKIGGAVQDVAVLFSDIRDFTAMSEKLSPSEVLAFLSEYHELMVGIMFKHGGTLDKFIGDAIMATFGTPRTGDDDALRAVRAAVEMEGALKRFNEGRERTGLSPIRHGIGIHYGPALVGNIGTRDRLEYTVLGDTVNVASRIERACKSIGASLLLSEAAMRAVGDSIGMVKAGDISVKGKTGEIAVYTVKPGE